MSFVLDNSVAISWFMQDEHTPGTDELLQYAQHKTIIVPALWLIEFANVLLVAEKRKRITMDQVNAALSLAAGLSIEIDDKMTAQAWQETISLARAENLTVYDAVYLELALRKNLPLATRDADLRAAATRRSVMVLPE